MKREIGLIKVYISTREYFLYNELIDLVGLLPHGHPRKTQGLPLEANLSLLCFSVEMKQREPKFLRCV